MNHAKPMIYETKYHTKNLIKQTQGWERIEYKPSYLGRLCVSNVQQFHHECFQRHQSTLEPTTTQYIALMTTSVVDVSIDV